MSAVKSGIDSASASAHREDPAAPAAGDEPKITVNDGLADELLAKYYIPKWRYAKRPAPAKERRKSLIPKKLYRPPPWRVHGSAAFRNPETPSMTRQYARQKQGKTRAV